MRNEKKFDAVRMMRKRRDELSKKILKKDFQEQQKYLKEHGKIIRNLQISH